MPRIVCISDTHGMHLSLQHPLPPGDIIVHTGDFCNDGNMNEVMRFFGWFNALDYKHHVCIAGNHDTWLEDGDPNLIKAMIPPHVHYLNDSGVEIEGLKFWGSPVQPTFFNWAFNRERGSEIRSHWELIPEGTDVLLTHGPVRGHHDVAYDFMPNPRGSGTLLKSTKVNVGCRDLLEIVDQIKPLLHVCGHVHLGYGVDEGEHTMFVNASVCNEQYRPINKPIVIDIFERTAIHVI